MNNITLIGRLGFNPDYRETPEGTKIVKLHLATNEGYGTS